MQILPGVKKCEDSCLLRSLSLFISNTLTSKWLLPPNFSCRYLFSLVALILNHTKVMLLNEQYSRNSVTLDQRHQSKHLKYWNSTWPNTHVTVGRWGWWLVWPILGRFAGFCLETGQELIACFSLAWEADSTGQLRSESLVIREIVISSVELRYWAVSQRDQMNVLSHSDLNSALKPRFLLSTKGTEYLGRKRFG